MSESTLSESRPDLIHPFQCQPGREGECSHFYQWLGGFVKCKMKESDPIHKNGPHMYRTKDGGMAYCRGPGLCWACEKGLPSCQFTNFGPVDMGEIAERSRR
jgi:hypothetical protein